jgi:DNA-binding MarR family transcriptional regulator
MFPRVLARLSVANAVTSSLAADLGVPHRHMSSVLSRMCGYGHVRHARISSAKGPVCWVWEITDRGRDALQEAVESARRLIAEVDEQ